jgi:cold shock CspA family protein
MGRSQETWNKKEIAKKKEKKRKDKESRKQEKKENPKEASSFDDMLAYVDEYGNISSTPPDPNKKKTIIKKEDIEIGVPKREIELEEIIRNGIVTHFNDSKGYGFIKDLKTQESVFVHVNSLIDDVKEGDKVVFEIRLEKKGLTAVDVKKAV